MNGVPGAVIAVVFDFDDTLVPDSTSALLEEHGIDVQRFWNQDAKALIKVGYDPTLAYLRLILDNIGPDKPLGPLSNASLRDFGRRLEKRLYPGLRVLIRDLRALTTVGLQRDGTPVLQKLSPR